MNKAELRKHILARRQAISPEEKYEAATRLVDIGLPHILELLKNIDRPCVGGYMPNGSEINSLPLMKALLDRGIELALPKVINDVEMVFAKFTFDSKLAKDKLDIMAPLDEPLASKLDLLLVPLCAFDERGGRLGHGKGCYDRFLGKFPKRNYPFTIGLAFNVQRVELLELEEHDVLMDAILTESCYKIFNNR